MEGQERNTAQLERIGATMEQRWSLEEENGKEENGDDAEMALERVRKEGLHRLPPVSVLVLFSFSIDFISSVN